MVKSDRIKKLDCPGVRKNACGYYIQPSCANCTHCIHYYSRCAKHGFEVNRDHGICRDFAWPDNTSDVAKNSQPHRRKTITKRTK